MDRITNLPSSIVETILYLVPIQEAARTSIRSREWRYHWTKNPELVFDNTSVEIDNIISHLSRNNTDKKLTLDFYWRSRLPLSLFSLSHLTYLYLNLCDFDHLPTFTGFGNLISLQMEEVNISKMTLLHLLSTSPLLKNLNLVISY